MKKRFGREMLLLTLPVLFFAGVAWWRTGGGSMSQLQGAPSDLYSGKPRLEIGKITPLQLSPWDVAQGFVWGIETEVWQGGESPVAPGVKKAAFVFNGGTVDVFYRRGSKWIEGRTSDDFSLAQELFLREKPFGDFALQRKMRIKARLEGVPRDAEEVRLRGYFNQSNKYRNAGCRGISPDLNWKRYPNGGCDLMTRSKPYDISILGPNKAWPSPQVSRETKVEVVDFKWLRSNKENDFVLHLRHKEKPNWEEEPIVTGQNLRVSDGAGKLMRRFSGLGAWYPQDRFHPDKPKNELMVPFVSSRYQPKGGWDKVKPPLTVEGEISDGECWPTKFKINVRPEQIEMKTLGAPK